MQHDALVPYTGCKKTQQRRDLPDPSLHRDSALDAYILSKRTTSRIQAAAPASAGSLTEELQDDRREETHYDTHLEQAEHPSPP